MVSEDGKRWNDAAESWVEFVRSGKNYYSEYLNGPALKRMIGDVEGKTVLDIGCGRLLVKIFRQSWRESYGN